MNSDLNRQAQALEVTFSRKTKSYHSQTCFNNILRIYLNKEFNFYHHIIQRNAQMHIRSENLFYQTNYFVDFKIYVMKSSIQLSINRDVTIFYCRIDIFKYLHFQSTITDTSHIPAAITPAKYLSTQWTEAFKPQDIGTYLFFYNLSFSNK